MSFYGFQMFSLAKTLVKNLANNLVKNLAKNSGDRRALEKLGKTKENN